MSMSCCTQAAAGHPHPLFPPCRGPRGLPGIQVYYMQVTSRKLSLLWLPAAWTGHPERVRCPHPSLSQPYILHIHIHLYLCYYMAIYLGVFEEGLLLLGSGLSPAKWLSPLPYFMSTRHGYTAYCLCLQDYQPPENLPKDHHPKKAKVSLTLCRLKRNDPVMM